MGHPGIMHGAIMDSLSIQQRGTAEYSLTLADRESAIRKAEEQLKLNNKGVRMEIHTYSISSRWDFGTLLSRKAKCTTKKEKFYSNKVINSSKI